MSNKKVVKIIAPYRGLETWRQNNVPVQVWNDSNLQTYLRKSYQVGAIFIIIVIFIFFLIKIGMFGRTTITTILWTFVFGFIGSICIGFVVQKWRKSIVPAQVWDEPHLKAYLKRRNMIIVLLPMIPFYVGHYAKIPVLTYFLMVWYLGVCLYLGFKKQAPKVNSSSDRSNT